MRSSEEFASRAHSSPLVNSRLLEPYAMVWIDQALKRDAGRDFAFALTRFESPRGRGL